MSVSVASFAASTKEIQKLEKTLAGDRDGAARAEAAWQLGQLGSTESVPVLITALEKVNIPLGIDAPGGGIVMNPQDHQGGQTVYVFRINGQEDELLNTVPAEQIAPLGSCKANS